MPEDLFWSAKILCHHSQLIVLDEAGRILSFSIRFNYSRELRIELQISFSIVSSISSVLRQVMHHRLDEVSAIAIVIFYQLGI